MGIDRGDSGKDIGADKLGGSDMVADGRTGRAVGIRPAGALHPAGGKRCTCSEPCTADRSAADTEVGSSVDSDMEYLQKNVNINLKSYRTLWSSSFMSNILIENPKVRKYDFKQFFLIATRYVSNSIRRF